MRQASEKRRDYLLAAEEHITILGLKGRQALVRAGQRDIRGGFAVELREEPPEECRVALGLRPQRVGLLGHLRRRSTRRRRHKENDVGFGESFHRHDVDVGSPGDLEGQLAVCVGGETNKQQGRTGPLEHVVQQSERRRLGQVQVVEDQQNRRRIACRGEQTLDGVEQPPPCSLALSLWTWEVGESIEERRDNAHELAAEGTELGAQVIGGAVATYHATASANGS